MPKATDAVESSTIISLRAPIGLLYVDDRALGLALPKGLFLDRVSVVFERSWMFGKAHFCHCIACVIRVCHFKAMVVWLCVAVVVTACETWAAVKL